MTRETALAAAEAKTEQITDHITHMVDIFHNDLEISVG